MNLYEVEHPHIPQGGKNLIQKEPNAWLLFFFSKRSATLLAEQDNQAKEQLKIQEHLEFDRATHYTSKALALI